MNSRVHSSILQGIDAIACEGGDGLAQSAGALRLQMLDFRVVAQQGEDALDLRLASPGAQVVQNCDLHRSDSVGVGLRPDGLG